MQIVVDLAAQFERKVAFVGRGMNQNSEIAQCLGYLRIPAGMQIRDSEIGNFPQQDVLCLTTGSQGEPMSALSRIAINVHRHVKAGVNDTVYVSPDFLGSLNAVPALVASYENGTPTIAACVALGDTTVTGSVFGVTVGVSIATGLVVVSPAHALNASAAVTSAISLMWRIAGFPAVEIVHGHSHVVILNTDSASRPYVRAARTRNSTLLLKTRHSRECRVSS